MVVPTPTGIVAAEAEGQRHPQAAAPAKANPWFATAPGRAERVCVATDDLPTETVIAAGYGIRSGEFIAGPFTLYPEQWARQPDFSKLWWKPLHDDRMPGLTVRAVLLDDPRVTLIVNQSIVAYNDAGQFYPSAVRLPSAGRWVLIATAGPGWGCFLLTLLAAQPADPPTDSPTR